MYDPGWAESAVQQLNTRRVRYVLWTESLNYPFDASRPATGHILPLREFLISSYRRTHVFSDGEEVWERK
jgi:hypothetical protein